MCRSALSSYQAENDAPDILRGQVTLIRHDEVADSAMIFSGKVAEIMYKNCEDEEDSLDEFTFKTCNNVLCTKEVKTFTYTFSCLTFYNEKSGTYTNTNDTEASIKILNL